MVSPVVVVDSVDLACSREEAWPLLTDTDRANRLLGTGPVDYRPIDDAAASPARFLGETRAGGFRLVYEELPSEWTHGRAFSIERRMREGPLTRLSFRWTLSSLRSAVAAGVDAGTRVTLRVALTPRTTVLWPVVWMNARKVAAGFLKIAAEIDAHVHAKGQSPYAQPVSRSDERQLALALEALEKEQGISRALGRRLGELVMRAPDADVVRIRPFELADEWGLDRREVLRACLRAVPAGLLELRWGLVCPSCRTASQQVRGLDEISGAGHCQLCDIGFELDLDRAVEATFLPHPSVREVPEQMFCIGGPARTPHVLVQALALPGEPRVLEAPATAGRYRVFVRGGALATLEVATDEAEDVSFEVSGDALFPPRAVVRPGGEVRVVLAGGPPRHVKIERLEYASRSATAHAVSLLGDFRSLFSSDLLKRGTPLKVARAAILFSDLTGSTALYSRVGDAAAFRLVDDHFDLLREVVTAHEGVVVKTMGDAVMAAFPDAARATRAALDVLARFEAFRRGVRHGELVGIKLGMFAGACYVVTANGALDYFGQTVNVASRVQHLAESGELVVGADTLAGLDDAERERLSVSQDFEAHVKGVEGALRLVRVRLPDADAEPLAPSVQVHASRPPPA